MHSVAGGQHLNVIWPFGSWSSIVSDSQFSSINVRCLFTPCHTSGHMCYFVWEDECTDAPAVFTGLWAERRPVPVPMALLSLLTGVKPAQLPLFVCYFGPQGTRCLLGGVGGFWRALQSRCITVWPRCWAPCLKTRLVETQQLCRAWPRKELTSTIMISDTSRRESQCWGNSRTMKGLIPVWLFSPFQSLKKNTANSEWPCSVFQNLKWMLSSPAEGVLWTRVHHKEPEVRHAGGARKWKG